MTERVVPIVRLLFACDDALYELDTERWVLTNPWSMVALPPGALFPFRAEEFWVYAQLSGGLGQIDVALEMRQLRDDGSVHVVGWSAITRFEFAERNRWLAVEAAFPLRRVPFREAGLYDIRLLAADAGGHWAALAGATCELRALDPRTGL